MLRVSGHFDLLSGFFFRLLESRFTGFEFEELLVLLRNGLDVLLGLDGLLEFVEGRLPGVQEDLVEVLLVALLPA